MLHAAEQQSRVPQPLSPRAATTEAHVQSPGPATRGALHAKPTQGNKGTPTNGNQRKPACSNQDTSQPTNNTEKALKKKKMHELF